MFANFGYINSLFELMNFLLIKKQMFSLSSVALSLSFHDLFDIREERETYANMSSMNQKLNLHKFQINMEER